MYLYIYLWEKCILYIYIYNITGGLKIDNVPIEVFEIVNVNKFHLL